MNGSKSSYLADESHTPERKTSHPALLRRLLNHLWQDFLNWAAARPEPKISQTFDRRGQRAGWQVFDPQTGRTAFLGSELEVRQWLEERYR
ncbi:hypothetical protein [Leptolyngbya ohadii]|uniref:hypothetical protein n=1 Tax=Leptolyngbya ohadii TaxID=1962290 RepID=UPI000B598BA4|nr:hypothetical protein [Leptolyngbya ohadii]